MTNFYVELDKVLRAYEVRPIDTDLEGLVPILEVRDLLACYWGAA